MWIKPKNFGEWPERKSPQQKGTNRHGTVANCKLYTYAGFTSFLVGLWANAPHLLATIKAELSTRRLCGHTHLTFGKLRNLELCGLVRRGQILHRRHMLGIAVALFIGCTLSF